ncbi:MAG TPA: hypothetical protein VMA34_03365, partial [Terracidiphilus sp.]|nr:hypothetical protein [Terracidiphilus sp.]
MLVCLLAAQAAARAQGAASGQVQQKPTGDGTESSAQKQQSAETTSQQKLKGATTTVIVRGKSEVNFVP